MKISHLIVLTVSCAVLLSAVEAMPSHQTHDKCLGFCNSMRDNVCGRLSEEDGASCIRQFTSSCMKSCLSDQIDFSMLTAGTNSLHCTCKSGRTITFSVNTCPPSGGTGTLLKTLCSPVCTLFGGFESATCTTA